MLPDSWFILQQVQDERKGDALSGRAIIKGNTPLLPIAYPLILNLLKDKPDAAPLPRRPYRIRRFGQGVGKGYIQGGGLQDGFALLDIGA